MLLANARGISCAVLLVVNNQALDYNLNRGALSVWAGASDRNRTGTPAMNEAADFKSAVSTNFTTEALG